MKLSAINFDRLSVVSPEYSLRRLTQRANTQRVTPFVMQSLSPHFSDPFREIERGNPNSKLQPILLKARMSPNSCKHERVSIKLPEITEQGRFKLNLHFLPDIKSSRVKSPQLLLASSPEARPGMLERHKSERFLKDHKAAYQNSFPVRASTEALEVSFGKCDNEANPVSLLALTLANSGCEHCFKLCQYNFDYVPLLQDNYCQGDVACENFLRDVSFRDAFRNECMSFSLKVCSDILQNSCVKGNKVDEGRKISLKDELEDIERQEVQIEQELKLELAREKQKYLRIINRLSELQLEISE